MLEQILPCRFLLLCSLASLQKESTLSRLGATHVIPPLGFWGSLASGVKFSSHFSQAPSLLTVEPGLRCDAATHAEAILPVADIEGRHGRMVGHLYERGDSGDGSRNSSPRNGTPLGPRRKCGARGTFLTVPGQSLNPSIWEPVQISESSKDAPC